MNERIDDLHRLWTGRAANALARELAELGEDRSARADAFYRDLAFGTGGLRGIVGAGTNRMNVHTVGRATQGLASYLNAHFDKPSVAVARDSRHGGEAFVQTVVGVMAANGIRLYAYPRIEPTPTLSWAVRDLGCSAGICITASHNPAAYNGYKVYGSDGCQITTEAAREIQKLIDAIDVFDGVKAIGFESARESGLFECIGDAVLDRYVDAVAALSFAEPGMCADLRIAYTPLHGTGWENVRRVLGRVGVEEIALVEDQAKPDGSFPTCPYPNPEIPAALERGLSVAADSGSSLLLATDPDADRVGVAVAHGGSFSLLTGNEVGILLLDYLCKKHGERGGDLSRGVVATTIVSSPMADALSRDHGFELRRTLTGFKYIGEQIGMLEAAGEADRFLFGFEESCGYLSGTHVRDKDAMNAVMLVCEMAAWHKASGRDLVEAMDALYARYGYFKEGLVSVDYPGADGAARMEAIMAALRAEAPAEIAGLRVEQVIDYTSGADMPVVNMRGDAAPQQLPAASVVEFRLAGGCKLIVRPSGTEPKVKSYAMARGTTAPEADELLARLKDAALDLLS